MVPWAYVVDSLPDMLQKIKQEGKLWQDPLSMREISAMADYNLARSRNLFGSLKNAFDQRAQTQRNVPMHMMPDYMLWLKHTQPEVYYHLYGPDPVPQPKERNPVPQRQPKESVPKNVVVAEKVRLPPVDEKGRIRHHHTYEEPAQHSYRVQSGTLNERRTSQIRPRRLSDLTSEEDAERRNIQTRAWQAAMKRLRRRS